MEYRQLGKTCLKVSALGLGAEHLKNLPAKEIEQIITLALKNGITYFDLVWNLPNILEGFKQTLKAQRKNVILAFHLGSCIKDGKYKRSRNPEECEKELRRILDYLDLDAAPVLNIHYVPTMQVWQEVNRKGIVTLAKKLKEEGLAQVVAMSTHEPEIIKLAAETGNIESIMHQVNLANHLYPARDEALKKCQELGIGVVAMKPFAAGTLLKAGKKVKIAAYQSGWKTMELTVPKCTTPTRLLSYTLSRPAVCTAVMGVSSINELEVNLKYLQASNKEKDFSMLLNEKSSQP